MIGETLLRMAIALPLILLLAAATLLAARRGWLPLPVIGLAAPGARSRRRLAAEERSAPRPSLDLVAVRAIGPTLRIAVVLWHEEELLIGIAPQGCQLLARRPAPQEARA